MNTQELRDAFDEILTNFKDLYARVEQLEAAPLITSSSGGGAPVDAEYLVNSANAVLTNEIVVTAAQGRIMYSDGTPIWTTLNIGAAGTVLRSDGSLPAWATLSASGIAPNNATYIVVSLDAGLTNERNLNINNGLTFTDNGANNSFDIDLGTPSTLDTTTTNTVGASTHEHNVTTTSDGATNHNTILQSNASGQITMDDYFTVNGGQFGISGNELLTFYTAGYAVFSGCNVGIGVADPEKLLHVSDLDLGTGWKSVFTSIVVESDDAYVELVSDDSSTWGSGIDFKQVDGTVYENSWSIIRQTNGDGSGDGSLRFLYGTSVNGTTNTTLVTIDTSGNIYVTDGAFIGTGTDGWTFDSSNGDITTSSKIGVNTTTPTEYFEVDEEVLSVRYSSDTARIGRMWVDPAAGLFSARALTISHNVNISKILDVNTSRGGYVIIQEDGTFVVGATDTGAGARTLTNHISISAITGNVSVLIGDLLLPTTMGIIHADGNTAGYVLRANGTRYIPAQLDYSDLANVSSLAGNGLVWDALNSEIDMGTPFTLNTTSINAVGVATHSHAITTTSDGATNHSTILQSSASGQLTLDDLFVTNGGVIGVSGGVQWLFDNSGGDITTTANVGIGVTAPGTIFVVDVNNTYADFVDGGDSDNTRVRIGDASGNGGYIAIYDDSENLNTLIRSYAISSTQAYFTAGSIAIGATTASAKLDVYQENAGFSIIFGADVSSDSRTDATRKFSRIGAPHYTNAEEPVTFGLIDSSISNNYVNIGGGTATGNAATIIRFYTAATTTTTTGSERARFDSNGRFGVNVTTVNAKTHIDQSSSTGAIPVLQLDQADVSEQCIDVRSNGSDVDINILTVDVTGTPTFWWDESEDSFAFTKGAIVSGRVAINLSTASAQLDIDQSSSIGAIPVLRLDQGDISEQCINVRSDGVDRDINIITVEVTGTPTFGWDESADRFDFSKSITTDQGMYISNVLGGTIRTITSDIRLDFNATSDYFSFTKNGNTSLSIYVGINEIGTNASLQVKQPSTTAAISTLWLEQLDTSEEFIEFRSTIAAGYPLDTAAVGTYYGKARVSVNGTFKYIALYN